MKRLKLFTCPVLCILMMCLGSSCIQNGFSEAQARETPTTFEDNTGSVVGSLPAQSGMSAFPTTGETTNPPDSSINEQYEFFNALQYTEEDISSVLKSIGDYSILLKDLWENAAFIEDEIGLSLIGEQGKPWILITGRERGDIAYSLAAGYIAVLVIETGKELYTQDLNQFGNIVFKDIYSSEYADGILLQVNGVIKSAVPAKKHCEFWYLKDKNILPINVAIHSEESLIIQNQVEGESQSWYLYNERNLVGEMTLDANKLDIRAGKGTDIILAKNALTIYKEDEINIVLLSGEFSFLNEKDIIEFKTKVEGLT